MIMLDSGNVPLKPLHRRQLFASLRRAIRLGERLGDFAMKITMHRTGRFYEVRATVHDRAGDFGCRTRAHRWRDALAEIVRELANRLHDQAVRHAMGGRVGLVPARISSARAG